MLAKCHEDLTNIFKKIMDLDSSGSRMLGSYYRVGFYGVAFKDLDGKEYIYKEPKITRLAEIAERLKSMFAKRFGENTAVHVLPDSNVVDRSKLDKNCCYLQITSVEPYFESWEMKDRISYFDRNNNLTRFIFETPFTQDGGTHGGVEEQYKRKTILTTELPFPYIKKRLLVVNKQEEELEPIENSIETLVSQTQKLTLELKNKPPNTKSLQSLLQGSILLQVNIGPFKICSVFLANASNYPAQHVQRLRQAFRHFLKVCKEGLDLNSKLIGPEQYHFQKQLEQGYTELKARVSPFVIDPNRRNSNSSASSRTSSVEIEYTN